MKQSVKIKVAKIGDQGLFEIAWLDRETKTKMLYATITMATIDSTLKPIVACMLRYYGHEKYATIYVSNEQLDCLVSGFQQ